MTNIPLLLSKVVYKVVTFVHMINIPIVWHVPRSTDIHFIEHKKKKVRIFILNLKNAHVIIAWTCNEHEI